METTLYTAHPSMFRNHPVWFVICCLLCLVVVGIPILLLWWLRCLGTTLTVTNEKTTFHLGILSKYTNEVYHTNVRNVQISQSFLQRLLSVGYIGISSAGQSGVEIELFGIPNPEKVKRLINQHRNA